MAPHIHVSVELAKQLEQVREQRGVLVRDLGISRERWNNIVKNRQGSRMTPASLAKVMRALELTPCEIGGLAESDVSSLEKAMLILAQQDQADAPIRIGEQFMLQVPPQLCGRDGDLVKLNDAWRDESAYVLTVLGQLGGEGKSSVLKWWYTRCWRPCWAGRANLLAWEFNNQQEGQSSRTSADMFINTALKAFGNPDPDDLDPWARASELTKRIREHRYPTLLILDGLEPLQKAPLTDSEFGALDATASTLELFLTDLAHQEPFGSKKLLCVLTTRLRVSQLYHFEDQTEGKCTGRLIRLGCFANDDKGRAAGARLLQSRGVLGDAADLERTSVEYGGYPLALVLLASFLVNFHKGRIEARNVPGSDRDVIGKVDNPHMHHLVRILNWYEDTYANKKELQLLRLLSLFDREASEDELQALIDARIEGLTTLLPSVGSQGWREMVQALVNVGLISETNTEEKQS